MPSSNNSSEDGQWFLLHGEEHSVGNNQCGTSELDHLVTRGENEDLPPTKRRCTRNIRTTAPAAPPVEPQSEPPLPPSPPPPQPPQPEVEVEVTSTPFVAAAVVDPPPTVDPGIDVPGSPALPSFAIAPSVPHGWIGAGRSHPVNGPLRTMVVICEGVALPPVPDVSMGDNVGVRVRPAIVNNRQLIRNTYDNRRSSSESPVNRSSFRQSRNMDEQRDQREHIEISSISQLSRVQVNAEANMRSRAPIASNVPQRNSVPDLTPPVLRPTEAVRDAERDALFTYRLRQRQMIHLGLMDNRHEEISHRRLAGIQRSIHTGELSPSISSDIPYSEDRNDMSNEHRRHLFYHSSIHVRNQARVEISATERILASNQARIQASNHIRNHTNHSAENSRIRAEALAAIQAYRRTAHPSSNIDNSLLGSDISADLSDRLITNSAPFSNISSSASSAGPSNASSASPTIENISLGPYSSSVGMSRFYREPLVHNQFTLNSMISNTIHAENNPDYVFQFMSPWAHTEQPVSNDAENYEALLHLAERLGEVTPRGMQKSEIDILTSFKFSASQNKDSERGDHTCCVICLCNFEGRALLRMLPCSHEYHAKCIDRWLKMNRDCPICRRDSLLKPKKSDHGDDKEDPHHPHHIVEGVLIPPSH